MLSATNGGLTIESGSATQEELDTLVGKPKETPSTTSATPAAESTQQPATTAPDSETGTPESKEQKEKGGGWQRRIDKLTKRNTELAETLESERLARQRLEANAAGKPAPSAQAAAADKDPEPDESQANPKTGQPWKDWKEFNREHTAWVTRQEIQRQNASRTQTEAQQAEHADVEKNFKAHQARLVAASAKYDDWDEVVESLSKTDTVPEGVGLALIELENSEDVCYHLGKNPDLITKLRGMSELKAIIELGRISDSLTKAKPAPVIPDVKPSPDTKPVSSAPAPIKPVGSSQTQAAPDPGKMPLGDYIKGRNSGAIK